MEKCTALLCSETIQEMDLIQVRFENILSLDLALDERMTTADERIARYQVPGCIWRP